MNSSVILFSHFCISSVIIDRLSEEAGFQQSVFSSLKAIKEDHYSFAVQALQKARYGL